MPPALFTIVSREQALAAFHADESAPSFCGGDFVKTEHTVLVFATIAGDAGARLDHADQIVWSPSPAALSMPAPQHPFWPSGLSDFLPSFLREALKATHGETTTWLPQSVRDCWDASRARRLFHHVLLLRHIRDGDRWLYCGRAHLGSYGEATADLTLEEGRLSPEHWRALDGWVGWRVTVDGDCRGMKHDDVPRFAQCLATSAARDKLDLVLTRWTGETFSFYFNTTRAVAFYMPAMGEPWTLRVCDPDPTAHATEHEPFFDSLGPCERFFERFRTIPRAAALKLTAAIFADPPTPKTSDPVRVEGFEGHWTEW